jgi:hypothetical protein
MNEIKNTKFYVVHSLKYSVQLDTNQTHMEVLCQGENCVTNQTYYNC